MVGLLFRAFSTSNPDLLLKAYTTYVRILETATVTWSPFLIKDIETIERVQKIFTKRLFYRCKRDYVAYEARCEQLNLNSLEMRRLKQDLCMCYKILHGFVNINSDNFLHLSTSNTSRVVDRSEIVGVDFWITLNWFYDSCEARSAEPRRGVWGTSPSEGSKGREAPGGGPRGAKPPGKFCIFQLRCYYWRALRASLIKHFRALHLNKYDT